MRDISSKIKTLRTAVAKATLKVAPATVQFLNDNKLPKGDPVPVAKVAAIQAAKNTHQIIPYCHPLPIDFVGVEFTIGETSIDVEVTVKAIYKTGVEMEALTAASAAVLTLYDMMKMVDETMEITGVVLVEKRGGKSEFGETFTKPLRAAVLVMSDSIAGGKKSDLSGRLIKERLEQYRIEVRDYSIIPDEPGEIKKKILSYTDDMHLDLVMTTGGTGMSLRDFTPETMHGIIEREVPGIPETLRAYGQERTPYSMLSRGRAGIRGNSLIINLPGSKRGVAESLDALFPFVLHSFKMLWGGKHGEQPSGGRSQRSEVGDQRSGREGDTDD
jgi:cyclic pyranopterin monophosphate synthase